MKTTAFLATLCCLLTFNLTPFHGLSNVARRSDINTLYYNKLSYDTGEVVTAYVSSKTILYDYTLFLYNSKGKPVDSVRAVNLYPQQPRTKRPFADGFGYKPSFTYRIHNLPSGIYYFSDRLLGYFIVKNSGKKNKKITLLWCTNTLQAYDSAGGRSFYVSKDTFATRADTLSFLRPVYTDQYYNFIRWMDKEKYDYQVISDPDMDNYDEIENSHVLIIVGHSEYWTRKARENFDKFIDAGNDGLILSGNNMWWQVRYNSDKSKIICFKGKRDPSPDAADKTLNWADSSLSYPILTSIGADWVHGGFGDSARKFASPGFKVTLPSSPILDGTHLKAGSIIPDLSHEYDGTYITGYDSNHYPVVDSLRLKFCKIELIAYDSVRLPNSKGGFGAFIAIKRKMHSGRIITVNGMGWCMGNWINNALNYDSTDTIVQVKITKNMIDLLRTGEEIFSTPVSCSYTGISENKPASIFTVSPNPSVDHFIVELGENLPQGGYKVSLFESSGRQILQKEMNGSRFEVDCSELKPGVYLLQLQGTGQVQYSRVCIVR